MRKNFYFYLILSFGILSNVCGQTQKNETIEKISNALDNYFSLDRESIHLHLNKNIFLTNEDIWFKGYIMDRKQNIPFAYTTNIFVALLDENGKKIDNKLIFASNGTFFGNIKLKNDLTSGSYYIHIYTNWMNNFIEDESYFQKIDIINEKNPSFPKKINNNHINPNISIHPEGGTLVYGINNTIGIKLLGCNNQPLGIYEGDLINSQGQFIKKIYLNKFGNGKFDLLVNNNDYKVVFNNIDGSKIEKELPTAEFIGVTLDINNYTFPKKYVAKIKTNKNSFELYNSKPLLLLIHQDNKATFFEINFNKDTLQQEIIFTDENLYEGVNTIRIINPEFKEIAQRLIFKYPNDFLKSDIAFKSNNKSIKFSGNLNFPNANISLSILPENTIATNKMPNIHESLLIRPYLNLLDFNTNYYFTDVTRNKRYEMDLFLLNQSSIKYNWNNILNNPPKNHYEFDYGLSIGGQIIQKTTNPDQHKMRLKSYRYQILEVNDLDKKNAFIFKNIVLPDSSKIEFTLLKTPKLESTKFEYSVSVLNGKRTFNKTFIPQNFSCANTSINEDFNATYEIPKVNEAIIYLDDVEVKQPNQLKRQNYFGNNNLRGYKVPENTPMDVLSYIEQNGFKVSRETGGIMISERGVSSINAAPSTPVVYIDNIRIISYEQLWGMRMDELDEIYINSTVLVPSMTNNRGIIKMYRKEQKYKPSVTDSKTYIVKNGFSKNENFKNISYKSYNDKGFENFGVINWIPNILANEKTNEFDIEIPEGISNRKARLIIEGFTSDGKIISEEKTIEIP